MTITKFVAPTTKAEAKAMTGLTIETPVGPREIIGSGFSGGNFNLAFPSIKIGKNRFGPEITWCRDRGFETRKECKIRLWTAAWAKLPKNARKLIEIVVGGELENIPVENRTDPSKLLRTCKARLVRVGAIAWRTCGRCGGGGRFSWNAMTGDTCFGCNGSGKAAPTTTACLKVAIPVGRKES